MSATITELEKPETTVTEVKEPKRGLSLFNELIKATTVKAVAEILRGLGDRKDAGLDRPFGRQHLKWLPFGGNTSNISTINLATDPGRALIERVTNAFDAVVESKKPTSGRMPTSLREALGRWFGRPQSGRDAGLFQWKQADKAAAVYVIMHAGEGKDYPTLDVVDFGTGIEAGEFKNTILSLQRGNKITKFYLGGTWGQGGSATLAFAPYTVIFSRVNGRTSFTIIRELEMGSGYKENCYVYLTDADGQILSIETPSPKIEGQEWNAGTMVRHINYTLKDLDGPLISTPGNLYHFLNAHVIDPSLPFRVVDKREKYQKTRTGEKRAHGRDELISGTRNRLMRLVSKRSTTATDFAKPSDVGTEIAHYAPMEYVKPVGAEERSIGIEYWVPLNWRKGEKDIILRPQSNELYVPTGHPILASVNGQVQGDLTAKLLRDIKLPLVAKHIVVHIDCTLASPRVRRDLFATTREGFKKGPILSGLEETLKSILEHDERLHEIEGMLADRMIMQESKKTSSDVREQVVGLMVKENFNRIRFGDTRSTSRKGELAEQLSTSVGGEGGGGEGGEPEEAKAPIILPFPGVLEWKIVGPPGKLEIYPGLNRLVTVQSDADAEFYGRGLTGLRFEPGVLEVVSAIEPHDGLHQWRVRVAQDETGKPGAATGATGKVIATITKPDGAQMSSELPFEVVETPQKPSQKDKDKIPEFEIIAISPRENPELWLTVWPELDPTRATEDELATVSYKPLRVGEGVHIYYSAIFSPFVNETERLGRKSKPISREFQQQYQVWIGVHALKQVIAEPKLADFDAETVDKLLTQERIRTAEVQVWQSSLFARLKSGKYMEAEKEAA